MEDETPPSRGRALKLALGLVISAAFLWALFRTVDFSQVAALIARADWGWLAAALGCVLLAYSLKIVRWTQMLRALGADVRAGAAATPFMWSVALNNVLPFRAGDVIRVVAFQRFTGIPPAGQLGTLALERLLDLLVLMSILFATVTFWRVDVLDSALLAGARMSALGVVGAIAAFLLAPRPVRALVRWGEARVPRLRRPGEALVRLVDAVATLSHPAFLARVTGLSALAWLAEGGVFYAVGRALGVAPQIEAALLALSVGTLSTIIPSSPGYVGTFHFFTARAVSGFGAGAANAAAYAILVHALLWLSTTATGFLLIARTASRRTAPASAPEPQGIQS